MYHYVFYSSFDYTAVFLREVWFIRDYQRIVQCAKNHYFISAFDQECKASGDVSKYLQSFVLCIIVIPSYLAIFDWMQWISYIGDQNSLFQCFHFRPSFHSFA